MDKTNSWHERGYPVPNPDNQVGSAWSVTQTPGKPGGLYIHLTSKAEAETTLTSNGSAWLRLGTPERPLTDEDCDLLISALHKYKAQRAVAVEPVEEVEFDSGLPLVKAG